MPEALAGGSSTERPRWSEVMSDVADLPGPRVRFIDDHISGSSPFSAIDLDSDLGDWNPDPPLLQGLSAKRIQYRGASGEPIPALHNGLRPGRERHWLRGRGAPYRSMNCFEVRHLEPNFLLELEQSEAFRVCWDEGSGHPAIWAARLTQLLRNNAGVGSVLRVSAKLALSTFGAELLDPHKEEVFQAYLHIRGEDVQVPDMVRTAVMTCPPHQVRMDSAAWASGSNVASA